MLSEQATSKRALRAAWHRVRKRRPVPGADGVTVEVFEAGADTYLAALQAEILDDHYTPQPLRRIFLRKEGGGERPVALPSLRDRIVQDALLHALRSPIDRVLGQGAHAYRPGRSAITALEAVQESLTGGARWILKGDIATFFDTLDHDLLRARLAETLGDDPVVDLVMRCVTGLVLDEMNLWDNRVGAPQGLALSPLLSNLYMVPFDSEMRMAGLNLVRYADDFVVLCATREEADQAERTARNLLAELRLRPKEEKWSVVSVSDGFVFLGYHFDDRGRGPSRKATEALSWRLESAGADLAKFNPTFEQRVECFRPIIRGWLGYFETLPTLGPSWDPPMVAAAALEVASTRAMDEASDILTRYVDAKGTVDAKGAALTTFDRLGLAGVAESLGLMWISLRERARALRAGPHDPDPNPPARAALAQSLGGDEYVEEFLTSADPFLGPPGPDGEPNPEDTPAQESVAWTLAEFLIIRGCQAAAYQMLRATGAGPAPSGLPETRSATYPAPPPSPTPPLPWPAPSLPPPPATDEDISAFLSLFAGRASGYAEEIQTDDGRRVLLYMDAPLDADAVRRHLGAERTLAIYPCREEATVTACVVDVDIGKRSLLLHPPGSPDFPRLAQAARSDALALVTALRVHGVPAYVEWTGRRGYHVWVFLEEPNVVIFGQAQVTTQAAHGLLDAGADVAFLTRSGRLKGLLSAGLSKNAVIRLAQYKRFSETSFRLGVARAIVAGKIKNQRVMVSRYCRRRQPPDEAAVGVAGAAATAVATAEMSSVLTSLDRGLAEAERAETPGALLGIEGSCTRAYFTAFGRMLREDFPWTGRSRRPPKDPPNALLSLGYVLVTNEVSCILSALSLDPYVGFFHGLRYGRASLALDLVEEFRHGLVDALTLDVLNRKAFTPEDFTAGDDGAVLLGSEALRRYLTLYETRLGSTITDLSGLATTWRGLVHQQAEVMRQAILRGSEYKPFVVE